MLEPTAVELEAAALAAIAVMECDGDGELAIHELTLELDELEPDERVIAEKARDIIISRL